MNGLAASLPLFQSMIRPSWLAVMASTQSSFWWEFIPGLNSCWCAGTMPPRRFRCRPPGPPGLSISARSSRLMITAARSPAPVPRTPAGGLCDRLTDRDHGVRCAGSHVHDGDVCAGGPRAWFRTCLRCWVRAVGRVRLSGRCLAIRRCRAHLGDGRSPAMASTSGAVTRTPFRRDASRFACATQQDLVREGPFRPAPVARPWVRVMEGGQHG
jgi:hypothetical protein